MPNLFDIAEKIGLVTLVVSALLTIFFFIIKWLLSNLTDERKQIAKERELHTQAIQSFSQVFQTHNEKLSLNQQENSTAHFYQREEHTRIENQTAEITKLLAETREEMRRDAIGYKEIHQKTIDILNKISDAMFIISSKLGKT